MTVRDVQTLCSLFQDDLLLPHTDEEVDNILKKKPNKTTKGKILIFPRNVKNGDRMTTASWNEVSGKWIKGFKCFTIVGEKQEVDWNSIIPMKAL